MPKRLQFEIHKYPIQYKNRTLSMTKPYTCQDFQKHTVLTDDVFTFVKFYFSTHKKTMKYHDIKLKAKHGDPNKYNYSFYWEQAHSFYDAAKILPLQSSPLAAYYSMLNASKALISFKSKYADEFISDFGGHGLNEDNNGIGEDLNTIYVKRLGFGVFTNLGKLLDDKFDTIWESGNSYTLKHLLYNLPFVHRAFTMTYDSKTKKVQELFIPLQFKTSPMYYRGNDGKAYLICYLDKSYFPPDSLLIPKNVINLISDEFEIGDDKNFVIKSVNGAKRNDGSISREIKALNTLLRKNFCYINGTTRLWYLKKAKLSDKSVINICDMLIILAAMHRFSEIVRYKPEQLARLMSSKENWLIHEFLTLALDQFIDEIAAEITGEEIMCTARK